MDEEDMESMIRVIDGLEETDFYSYHTEDNRTFLIVRLK